MRAISTTQKLNEQKKPSRLPITKALTPNNVIRLGEMKSHSVPYSMQTTPSTMPGSVLIKDALADMPNESPIFWNTRLNAWIINVPSVNTISKAGRAFFVFARLASKSSVAVTFAA